MANTEPARAIPLSIAERTDGLNHIAMLRGKHFKTNSEKEMCRFIDDMRDKIDDDYHKNMRVLSAIFELADIDKERHHLKFNELTTDEKERLIKAMNKLRAVVSLFPKNLILPL
ncbi:MULTISPECIES: DUF5347 family protein [Dickeya]|uniref:DUF5347 domain-containing protein n=3 Tax=Dickeya TaxID=204037 RepID=A0A5B8I4W4_9GAMM|nr:MULTISPECIES: DUF5347 family protein [Dickeya]AJC66880.1 hypothetical protein W909_12660 [Dickeya zeae EC1]MBP2856573.1 DUF5347 domain-containing protein [Dickeya oryzae]NKI75784.1 hypothetical protein [Dickeya sp. CFBP 2040]QDX29613.1 hypothetical protein Dpoa569_0001411 [Dickeya poaceiphila]QYM91253.1 hypothetical protein FGI21_04840 [Dickeya zeae]